MIQAHLQLLGYRHILHFFYLTLTSPSEPLDPIEWNCMWIIIGDQQAKFFNNSVCLHIKVREQVFKNWIFENLARNYKHQSFDIWLIHL